MAKSEFLIGSPPPTILWTVVRGDTAAFKVYVTDDERQPLNIPDWTIDMDIKRLDSIVMSLTPSGIPGETGYFAVSLSAAQSEILETGDIFDIQLSDESRVWTVARGSMKIIEDVTD